MSPLLRTENLTVRFPLARTWPWESQGHVHAVTDVSLDIAKGEALGLVGESGCGKSTLGRAILRLGPAARATVAGRVLYEGMDLVRLSSKQLRDARRKLQIMFQNPYGSLNPRMTVEANIRAAMENFGVTRREARERTMELMALVGLPQELANRYPHELSGGQQQRVGIARALALNPAFVVCDEPVSALDVSIQAQVLNELATLREKLGLTLLFISHDLRVVRHVCDRIAVMYLGRIVEVGSADQIVSNPQHPYTNALVSAIPKVDPDAPREGIVLKGDLPSPAKPPSGCAFRTRCPIATSACSTQVPRLRTIQDRPVACDRL